MRRCTLEATKENVLQSIADNTYNRSNDIKDFIEALEMIEGNMFISLDARWGEGKTFYVRQIEYALKYLSGKSWGLDVSELEPYFSNSILRNIHLSKTYMPIYYNAWLYDNHDDPLMSLILTMTKESENFCDTKLDSAAIGDKIIALVDSFSLSIKNIQISGNLENVREKFKRNDILSSVKTADEIRNCVKQVFNSIIVEKAQKLVVFIDELDRCRPSYAMEMLESIKHYFDDDRIIFVVSVNKEQLIHTITRYYGDGFDSTAYLNKFFDINVYLPAIDTSYREVNEDDESRFLLHKIAEELSDYYKLTFRDYLVYKQRIHSIRNNQVNGDVMQGILFSTFVSIIVMLDIVDIAEKQKFMSAESDILSELFMQIPTLYRIACRLGNSNELSDEGYRKGYSEIEKIYRFAFSNRKEILRYNGKISIHAHFKEMCIGICNGFK